MTVAERPQFPTGVTPITYAWRPGFPHRQIDPNVAGKEFERIEKHHGKVVPQTVVETSRGADAPLHTAFEWEDMTAGPLWREYQAQQLISAIYVINIRNDTEDELPPTRAYVRVTETPKNKPDLAEMTEPKSYTSVARVMSDEDLREAYVRQAFKALVSWRERYQEIREFARVFEEIDKLRNEIDI